MGCRIDGDQYSIWTINLDTINELNNLLFKDYEIGGKFEVNGSLRLDTYKTKNGGKDSVEAPKAIVNFHTHPVSCYQGEDTVWGWFSAEDIRETLLFTLKGSVAHLVLAVEGVYVLQLNPCKLESFKNLEIGLDPKDTRFVAGLEPLVEKHMGSNTDRDSVEYAKNYSPDNMVGDIFRGLVVLCIEIYFRATHRFRMHDINKGNNITPQDFIKYVNSFQLGNLFAHGEKIKGCGKIKCGGVPTFEQSYRTNKFHEYLEDYEKNTIFYLVDIHGHTLFTTKTVYDLGQLIGYLDTGFPLDGKCTQLHSNWDGEWFHMTLAPNKVGEPGGDLVEYQSKKITGNKRKKLLETMETITTMVEPEIYYFPITDKCTYKDIINFNSRLPKDLGLVVYAYKNCGYCQKLDKLLKNQRCDIKWYNSIEKALDESGNVQETVPVVFTKDGKLIGGFDDVIKLLGYGK